MNRRSRNHSRLKKPNKTKHCDNKSALSIKQAQTIHKQTGLKWYECEWCGKAHMTSK